MNNKAEKCPKCGTKYTCICGNEYNPYGFEKSPEHGKYRAFNEGFDKAISTTNKKWSIGLDKILLKYKYKTAGAREILEDLQQLKKDMDAEG